jgi:hypothetical protein
VPSKSARAVRRIAVDQARNEGALLVALQSTAQVGLEWRAFERSTRTLIGRLRWLVTGRLAALTPNEAEARDLAASREQAKTERTEEHGDETVQAPIDR